MSVASAAASSSATACAGGRPACRARACAVRPSLSVAVSAMPGTGTPSWSASSDSLATRWTTTSWTVQPANSGGSTGRAQSSTVRSRSEQDRPRQLDAVDVDRRGAGDRLPAGARRRRASASTRDRNAAAGATSSHDRGGELAGRGPQVLLPADRHRDWRARWAAMSSAFARPRARRSRRRPGRPVRPESSGIRRSCLIARSAR